MGRYATIQHEYNEEDTELCCSGILAQAINHTIGQERFEEWSISMPAHEVCSVMFEMVKLMSVPIPLDYQKVKERETGYRKLAILMLWHRDATILQTLTFC